MEQTLEEICYGLLDDAIYAWQRDGGVITTSFVLGHSRSMFASPITEEAFSIDDATRVRLHALLASLVGATVIGRIDESYKREVFADAPRLTKSELEELAKTDPNIKTALVVQAMDTRTGDSLACLATLKVDDDGEPDWDFDSFANPEGDTTIFFYETAKLANALRVPITDDEVRTQLRELGWALSDSDEIADIEWDD